MLLSQPLRSRKQYIAGKILLAGAIFISGATILLSFIYSNLMGWSLTMIASVIVLACSPDIETVKYLWTSYDKYLMNWSKHSEMAKGDDFPMTSR